MARRTRRKSGGGDEPRPRDRDRVWRWRFLALCGAFVVLVVLAGLGRPSGDPHEEEALLPGGQIGKTPTIGGRALYGIAGCEASAVGYGARAGRRFASVFGQDGAAPSNAKPSGRAPTIVGIGLFIVEVVEVNEVENTFTLEGFMDNVWCDPRRAATDAVGPRAAKRLEEGWQPDIAFVDEVKAPVKENEELIVRPNGTVEYKEKFNVTLEARYDLRKFPFDRQRLDVEMESFEYPSKDVELKSGPVGFSERFEIPEWRATNLEREITTRKEERDRDRFSEMIVTLEVDRETGFYIWKLLVPLVFLVATSWSVFWMSGESLAARVAISFTGILAIVAYQFVINDVLPKVTYFTLWDTLLTLSFALMTLTVAVNVLQAVFRVHDREPLANELDATARVVFPVTYVAALGVFVVAYLA